MLGFVILLYSLILVQANTETHIVRVPNYFNIPNHPELVKNVGPTALNETHSIIYDYPITTKFNYDNLPDTINLDPLNDQELRSILVRLNNHGNATYNSNDLLFIKCCWPATYPMDIHLDHTFIHSNKLNPQLDTFDMYLVVTYTGNFKTFGVNEPITNAAFKLVVEKLPNKWLPIPLEVYDIIMYLVDILLLLVHVIPFIYVSI